MYESKYHYEPHPEEDVVYEDELDYSDGERVVFDTGSRYGGLDLAAALGLTGVGYVANSGGALHIVGRRREQLNNQRDLRFTSRYGHCWLHVIVIEK